MPNDVRGYGSVWSEKEKIGVLQAGVAMLLRTAVGATACDGARRREEKRVWPSGRWGDKSW